MLHLATLPFTATGRQSCLDRLDRLTADLAHIREDIEHEGESDASLQQEEGLIAALLAQRALYREQTPIIPLSRCPYTGLELHYSIDTFGLDGPWWDVEEPVRALQGFPPTAYALTGAIALHEPYEFTQHIVSSGPGAPYVIPRMLAGEDTAAVLSSVPIGHHQGYAITYFGYPPRDDRPVVDEWGCRGWDIQRGISPGWDSHPLALEDCDFDLAPWIQSGRLLWIETGDSGLSLQAGIDTCPYLGLKGNRRLQTLYEGRLS